MDSLVALAFKGFLELLAVIIAMWVALLLGKYLMWRSGACLPGVVPCK